MRKLLLAAVLPLILLGTPAIAQEFTPEEQKFIGWLDTLESRMDQNPQIKEIPIESEQQEEYLLGFLYALYSREITKDEFIDELDRTYPGYLTFLHWVTEQLP